MLSRWNKSYFVAGVDSRLMILMSSFDRLISNLAPITAVLGTLLIWAVIPFSPVNIGVDLGIGLLYFVGVSSIGTLSVIITAAPRFGSVSLVGGNLAMSG